MVGGGTDQPWAARPDLPLHAQRHRVPPRQPAVAPITGSIAARILAAASRIALPLITVVRLATVGPLSGTRDVSASITCTSSHRAAERLGGDLATAP